MEKPTLKRELTLFDATLIVIGSMVGSGIFIVSSDIALSVGSPAWLMGVWALTGLITLMAALSYGELAAMMPAAGGQYVYLRESYGPLVGFLYGWTLLLIIQTGTIAAVAVAFAKFSAVIFPILSITLYSFGGLTISGGQALAIASVMLLTGINGRGVKTGKQVQRIFTIAKILALLLLIGLGIALGRNAEAVTANFHRFFEAPFSTTGQAGGASHTLLVGPALLVAVGAAMVGSLFSSDAWNNITFTAGEVRNPQKNIPLSLFLGTLAVTTLYLLANVCYLLVLPIGGSPHASNELLRKGIMFATDQRVATATMGMVFGQPAIYLMAALIMISTFGCNNGLIMAGARVSYAMAEDGLFFSQAGRLNRFEVPAFALWIQAIWTSLLCLSGSYGALLDYVIFAVLIFYILTVVGVFILRSRRPDANRPYRAWGYPVVPALYVVVAAIIATILLISKWQTSKWGLIIVVSGVPVYYLFARFFKASVTKTR